MLIPDAPFPRDAFFDERISLFGVVADPMFLIVEKMGNHWFLIRIADTADNIEQRTKPYVGDTSVRLSGISIAFAVFVHFLKFCGSGTTGKFAFIGGKLF